MNSTDKENLPVNLQYSLPEGGRANMFNFKNQSNISSPKNRQLSVQD